MNIIPFEKEHVKQAGELLWLAYETERSTVPALPKAGNVDFFAQLASEFTGNGMGVAAVDDGRLNGFLTGMAVGELFGLSKGVYIPLHAHAARGRERQLVYQQLYAAASEIWVKKGLLSHVVTVYVHDKEAVNAWFWQDFGLRCVDAIRPLSNVPLTGKGAFDIRRVEPKDAGILLPLHREHWRYYRNAPLFMKVHEDCTLEELQDWLSQKDQYAWAAYEDGVPVSYMQLRHGGETFTSDDEKSMNICGAYTKANLRRGGYGTAILQTIVQWLREKGFERLGVDYESFNIYGSRFWGKHFTPFTYSLTRRIDERVVE